MGERPIEPNCFETDREEQWHGVGYFDGYNDAIDKAFKAFCNSCVAHCNNDGNCKTCINFERFKNELNGVKYEPAKE